MSFLNPINEPVLRFKSTDASAPQIDYNARTAGDVKAVLKACLVTGYGSTASAGWSIVNEVDHVCEFVSPSAAMSDYRLGVDDTSTSSTTWYYQYQNSRVDPSNATPSKLPKYIDKTSLSNGWQVLVTDRAFIFVEFSQSSASSGLVGRVLYFGQIKSSSSNNGQNMAFWHTGWHGSSIINAFFSSPSNSYFNVNGVTSLAFSSANIENLKGYSVDTSTPVEIHSLLYLYKEALFVGLQPAVLFKSINKLDGVFSVKDVMIEGRPALHVGTTREDPSISRQNDYAKVFVIYLDYWSF